MKLIPLRGKGYENLYRHPKTGIIYFSKYRESTGRVERSTYTSNLTKARKIADNYARESYNTPREYRGRQTCGELFPKYISQKQGKSKKTVYSITNSWRHLKPFIEDLFPDEITNEFWLTVYVPKKKAKAPNRKFFNDRKWLRMFLLNLKKAGALNNVPDLENIDPTLEVGRVFTHSEIDSLLHFAHGDLKLQIILAITTGMRKGEILGLSWDRVDLDKKLITLRAQDTKIKKARTFPFTDIVADLLNERVRISPYLFPSPKLASRPQMSGINRAWALCKLNAGVFGRFHDLRHTFLTNAFKTKIAPAIICYYAGLSLEVAEKTYLHFKPDDARGLAEIAGNFAGKLVNI